MSYCPRCQHEYAESVEVCIDCGTRLRPGRRPVSVGLELEDYLIPVGAVLCDVFAVLMLYLRFGAQAGWIRGPIAQVIVMGQPPCMTVFYAVALIASTAVLAWWAIQNLVLRRG